MLLDYILPVDGFYQIGQSFQVVFRFLELSYIFLEPGVNHVINDYFLLVKLAVTILGSDVASFRNQFLTMLATDRLGILLSFLVKLKV